MEFIAGLSEWGYFGLFIAAFLAGSIIPFSSEAVLGLLLIAGYDSWGCVFSATLGNWLGGVTCYYIGYLGKTEWIHTYLKIPEEKLSKATLSERERLSFRILRLYSGYRRHHDRDSRTTQSQSSRHVTLHDGRKILPILLGGNRYQLSERVVSQSFLILNPIFIVFQ